VRRLSIALVHHPVLDAKGGIVTSTLTTMDVHDCARSARTYGCESFFIVHPIEAQQTLAHRIVEHWTHGSSAKRIPDRKHALALVRVVSTIAEAVSATGDETELWVTAARADMRAAKSWTSARADLLSAEGPPVLLLFGTSWGLASEVVDAAHALLEPIRGVAEWNHLSVRAACAIALDRLKAPI
jgi:hypothetical protein